MKIRLGKYQSIFLQDESRFKQLVAGRRFGKTFTFAVDIAQSLMKGENDVFIYSVPTYSMATKIMLPMLNKILLESTIAQVNKSSLSIKIANGNVLYLVGSYNYDSHRGLAIKKAWLDEAADQPEEIWTEVIRPSLSDTLGSCVFGGTPKGQINWFYDLTKNSDIKTYQFTTLDGGRVPFEEIEYAKRQLDERTFRQEYLASFESAEGLVYYAYGDHNKTDRQFNPNLFTILSWDFNVNPMSCIIIQKENGIYYAVKEFVLENANTELTADYVKQYLMSNGLKGRLEVTGDATGQYSKSSASVSDYELIKRAFKDYWNFEPIFRLKPTRTQRDRVGATNSLFRAMNGDIRLYINTEECPKLHKDLSKVQWKKGGNQIDKQLGISDPSDALSYTPYNYEPIQAEIQWSKRL